MEYILIVGAKSAIAKAIAHTYAQKGYNLYLAARNSVQLEDFSRDLRIRYTCEVSIVELDILQYETHQAIYESLKHKPIGVISVVGYLGTQENAQHNSVETQKITNTNYTGPVNFLNIVANDFEINKKGFIVGISSVAGDRGRKTNYTYGAAKAAFSTYLSGLRNRLYAANVHVLDVKPGFVDTPMTVGMNLPKLLTAQPNEVAKDIFKAQQKQKNTLYTKYFWKYIMLIIKLIPEPIFKKMNL